MFPIRTSFKKRLELIWPSASRRGAISARNRSPGSMRWATRTGNCERFAWWAKTSVSVGDDVMLGEKIVGTLSSVATYGNETVALAVLRKSACEAGTEVRVGDALGVVEWYPASVTL